MGFPVTINGRTWTEEHFQPWAYAKNFPEIVRDMATVSDTAEQARRRVELLVATAATQRLGTVLVTGTTALTAALHQGRMLQVSGGGTLTMAWADTGAGFCCTVLNLKATALALLPSGTSLSHPDGHARVRPNGLAALIGTEGLPGVLQLIGQTEP